MKNNKSNKNQQEKISEKGILDPTKQSSGQAKFGSS